MQLCKSCVAVRGTRRIATPSELRTVCGGFVNQGFKANPGLKLANAFSVIRRTLSFHTVSVAPDARVYFGNVPSTT
jgi:hypothetical protein